ncbi:MAG TPA: ABC transporter ATP-binding protein [Vicinamibacterales bacterium]
MAQPIARRIVSYLRPYWPLAACSLLLVLAATGANLLAPWPLKILIDHVLAGQPLPTWLSGLVPIPESDRAGWMLAAVIGGLAVTLLANTVTVLSNYVNVKLEQWMVLDFRSDLFRHAQRLSMTFIDSQRSGGLMYRINNQASTIGSVPLMIPPLARSALTLAGMFWIAYSIDRTVALASLAVVPALYAAVGYYTGRVEPRLRQVKGMEAQSLSIVYEAITILRVIVAFCREPYEYRRFRTQGESAVAARVGLTVQQTAFSLMVNTATAGGTALVLWLGAHRVLDGRLTVGELLVLTSYIASVYQPLEAISTTVTNMREKLVGLRSALALLDRTPEVREAPDAVRLPAATGRVAIENVSFSYPKRKDTLRQITLTIEPGEFVALVGPTGAGKSTLLSLIPRFYDPHRGRVLIDGHDIRTLTLESLRSQISIVLQDPLLFSGTIADNIRYGRLEATDEEVVAAAQAANAHDFISRLPQGYETVLGERGAQLSGGERQRIAIARAFLKNAPILLLDEPTSSIDVKTEAIILDALDRLAAGRTTLMISHRLPTVRHADRIYVLDRGAIVASGTHDELITRPGLYSELYTAQTRQRRAQPDTVLRAQNAEVRTA